MRDAALRLSHVLRDLAAEADDLDGLVLARRDRVPCFVVAATLVTFCLLHLLFWGEIRNRQFLTPLLYCFAGLAISHALSRRRASDPAVPGR